MLVSLRSALRVGWTLAIAWALVEGGAHALGGGSARLLPAALFLYLVMGTALGLVAGLTATLWTRLRRRGSDPALAAALVASLAALAVAGLWLNTHALAGFLEPASLSVNALLLFLGLPALTWTCRAAALRLARPAAASWRRVRLPLAASALAAAVVPWFAAPASSAVPPPPEPPAAAHPNLLFVLVDTLRADHLGCYGYARPTSPRMDRLAAAGVTFERCIAQASHTKPSTASILTSLHPPSHGMESMAATLPEEARTLHEAFYAAGYRTAAFSGNSFVSRTFGFGKGVERFRGAVVSPSVVLAGYQVMARLRDVLVYNLGLSAAPWRLYQVLVDAPFDLREDRRGMTAPEINAEFAEWLEEIGPGRPWLAYLHYMEPHAPYDPPLDCRIFGNPTDRAVGRDVPQAPGTCFLPFVPGVPVPPEQLAAMIANYDGDVLAADRSLEQALALLEQRGELANTVVVVTADHGEEFLDHGAWGHGQSLHRELVHVPLLLCWPGRLPAGARVAGQVRSVDIMPTLLDLCGLPASPGCQGESLLPLLEAGAAGDRAAFSEVHWGGSRAQALREGGRALIESRMGARTATQLFDVEADPAERDDISAALPDDVARLLDRMRALREALAQRSLRPGTAALDAATRANLADLGYVGD